LNNRERLLAALNHSEGDRVPLDIGATLMTGISKTAYANLLRFLGMKEENIQG